MTTPSARPRAPRPIPDAVVAAVPLLLFVGLFAAIGVVQVLLEGRRVRRERGEA